MLDPLTDMFACATLNYSSTYGNTIIELGFNYLTDGNPRTASSQI